MIVSDGTIAGDVLLALRAWGPWIWSASSVVGVVICGRLWAAVHSARSKLAWRELDDDDSFLVLLHYFERLAITGAGVLIALVIVGLSAKIAPGNAYVGIATFLILLVLPTAITWIVYRALTLRLER